MTSETELKPARALDYFGIAAFCLLLFGYAMFDGRPLSLHEARLPQTSREMMRNGDWLIPRSGGRPWLERPPLPHWITVSISAALGQHCDQVWVVRLPAVLMGTLITLLTLFIAARLFGRGIGVVSALVLATAYEFYTYSTLAEDDIFLAAVVVCAMACFVAVEFRPGELPRLKHAENVINRRPWQVLAFFALLGLSNMAKGPLVGTAVAVVACAGFLLWGDRKRVLRYVWLWGWLLYATIALAWPLLVMHKYADARKNWLFDYGETTQYDEHFWYYPRELLGRLVPWTPAVLIGLWLLLRLVKSSKPGAAVRFLLCWSVLPVLLLSIPHRKHHHYLVPSLAPWAILGAVGLVEVARAMFRGPVWSRRPAFGLLVFGLPGAIAIVLLHKKIPGPTWATASLSIAWVFCVAGFYLGLHRQSRGVTLGSFLSGLVLAYSWGQTYLPDEVTADTAFLRRIDQIAFPKFPLAINADLHGELDFFRNSFYTDPSALLLHNLTFLRDQRITSPAVYVITRAKDQSFLETLGTVQKVDQSARARREKSSADRFTLFLLRFRPDLERFPAPLPDQILTMEAMGRLKGPYCGPPPP